MDPIAFEVLGVSVRWYGILISLGLIIGTIIGIKEAKRIGLDEDIIIDLLLFAIPFSIIGARIYYVVFSLDEYKGDILRMINIREGGLAIHGALIMGILVAIIFCKVKKINFWTLADTLSPSIILGQGIGRWGNFLNQEAHGGPTDLPWGIIIDGQKVHPTFLYESTWNIIAFLFLIWYRKNKSKVKGETFLLYLILYSIGRLFIEGLRTDSLMFGMFRVAQLISLATIVVAIVMLLIRKKSNKNHI